MSGETLALETQLLLQEVTQAKQFEAAPVVHDGTGAGDVLAPPTSEFEAAKQALVDKLRKKKEQSRQQQQKLFVTRYGFTAPTPVPAAAVGVTDGQQETPPDKAAAPTRLTPSKAKRMVRLPVTASSSAGSRQKKDFLSNLRTQAIQQGAQEMAKLFGYKSYEDQIKVLNKKEKKIILEGAMAEAIAAKTNDPIADDAKDEDSSSDFVADADGGDENDDEEGLEVEVDDDDVVMEGAADDSVDVPATTAHEVAAVLDQDDHEETQDLEALEAASRKAAADVSRSVDRVDSGEVIQRPPTTTTSGIRRRRNHIALDEDDDGNEADSEEDGKGDEEQAEDAEEAAQPKAPRDKAAAFRQLLQAEAKQERKRKRLRQGENFVESEADEDEEEDVLKIGGLGDFGFGVPQATSKEAKDAEDERNALKMREDDLEGIVDDLSDDERDQAQDLDEIYRRELEEQDRQQVKEVMRNVKEGFGRNRRAFSSLDGGVGARGRFNLNQLVAADGDKIEAARLGLLESDEDMSDKEDEEEADESKPDGAVEEDEEEEMERVLRERYTNQPKIYITSSESENEEEDVVENDGDTAAKEEIESDEERERQQMKLFSERARINRRMQRMKDMQRQIAEEVEEEGAQKAPLPNILLEEDEDSQSLMKVLTRTDVTRKPSDGPATMDKSTSNATSRAKPASGAVRPKVGRFNSFGMGSAVRSTSSFSRVADNCKLFSAGSSTASASKGFVFTSFSSDKTDKTDENAAPSTEDSEMGAAPSSSAGLTKSKSWGGKPTSRPAKRPFAASNGAASSANGSKTKKGKSDFFSVLASYQCVSQSSSSQQ